MKPADKERIMERTLIERHCAHKDMYDDGGYCETKIKKYQPYYWAGVADGNGETMCPECMLQCLIHQLKSGGCIPEYIDNWGNDFAAGKALTKLINAQEEEGKC